MNWQQLQTDLQTYLPLLQQAAETVRDENVSNYPLFVAYRGEETAAIGLPVIQQSEGGSAWTVNVTTLEELVARKVVALANIDGFRQVYKEHTGKLCFLIWDEGEARFAFVPTVGGAGGD